MCIRDRDNTPQVPAAPSGKHGKPLKIAMIGHKRIPSREGGVEIVVDELSTRLVKLGCRVDAYNRYGRHTAGKKYCLLYTSRCV